MRSLLLVATLAGCTPTPVSAPRTPANWAKPSAQYDCELECAYIESADVRERCTNRCEHAPYMISCFPGRHPPDDDPPFVRAAAITTGLVGIVVTSLLAFRVVELKP
ncbi:MAG TPA: hypothetical protein VIV11_25500 [Kofleriaceae bacterium]